MKDVGVTKGLRFFVTGDNPVSFINKFCLEPAEVIKCKGLECWYIVGQISEKMNLLEMESFYNIQPLGDRSSSFLARATAVYFLAHATSPVRMLAWSTDSASASRAFSGLTMFRPAA